MDKQATRAKEIIHKLLYITIATVSKDGAPWNTPVYAAFDEEYNFYWCSDSQAQHSRNIAGNEDVFIVIYDSTVSAGKGYPWTVEELRGEGRPRVYKAVPEKVWMNKDGEADGSYIDVRVEINLLSN